MTDLDLNNIQYENFSLDISFGLDLKDKKGITERINFLFFDNENNEIFTSVTKEDLLALFTEKLR